MTIALVAPDGLTVVLFCLAFIDALKAGGRSKVIVVADVGPHRAELEALGVECVDVPMSRFIDPLSDARYVATLRSVFKRYGCDAVVSHSTKPNVYAPIAARMAGVPRVVNHVVGLGATFVPDGSLKSAVMRRVLLGLYCIACSKCDRVWFTNPADREFFVRAGVVPAEKTILTRNYLDTEFWTMGNVPPDSIAALRLELGITANAPVVLMVARLIRSKGVVEFAQAAHLLREKHPAARFLLVAPEQPPSAQTIAPETIHELEREGNFRWLGFRPDVRRLYALCDLAVLPTYYKEGGYPRALLEPMSLGKPLVTTTSEDCRATVDEGRNGFLVPPRDANALADAIDRLLSDASLRSRFGEHSRRKAVAEFDERPIVTGALRAAGLVQG